MVAKRTVRKQQNISRTVQDPLAQLLPVADAFNAAVGQCVEDADPEAVHRLRTGSRRLQAILEATLREAGPAAQVLQAPAKEWLRQLKEARRAASPVRDLDVQHKLLEDWMSKRTAKHEASVGTDAEAQTGTNQPEVLVAWLKSERKHLERGMQKQIRKRQPRLTELQGALFTALAGVSLATPETLRSADSVALEDFVRAADAMPVLDADNLHDFRKATKKARYVAEAGAEGQGYSSVAKALKRVQDAIGEWHDWLCLAEEAKGAVGERGLEWTAVLEHEVERSFRSAMKTTESMRGQLSGEWMAAQAAGKRLSAPVAIPTATMNGRRAPSRRRSA